MAKTKNKEVDQLLKSFRDSAQLIEKQQEYVLKIVDGLKSMVNVKKELSSKLTQLAESDFSDNFTVIQKEIGQKIENIHVQVMNNVQELEEFSENLIEKIHASVKLLESDSAQLRQFFDSAGEKLFDTIDILEDSMLKIKEKLEIISREENKHIKEFENLLHQHREKISDLHFGTQSKLTDVRDLNNKIIQKEKELFSALRSIEQDLKEINTELEDANINNIPVIINILQKMHNEISTEHTMINKIYDQLHKWNSQADEGVTILNEFFEEWARANFRKSAFKNSGFFGSNFFWMMFGVTICFVLILLDANYNNAAGYQGLIDFFRNIIRIIR